MNAKAEEACPNLQPRFVPLLLTRYTLKVRVLLANDRGASLIAM